MHSTDNRESWLVGSNAEWHSRYIERLMDVAKIDRAFAQATLDAGKGEIDYSYSPEDAADEELSCWAD